jgi:Cu/Ag efflux protein CusF
MTKTLFALMAAGAAFALAAPAQAHNHGAAPAATAPAAPEWTAAEVRKIDAEAGKITLKHAEIKHLDMPPMTMVFHLKDKALLNGLKVGDKLQVVTARQDGKFVVTELKPAN